MSDQYNTLFSRGNEPLASYLHLQVDFVWFDYPIGDYPLVKSATPVLVMDKVLVLRWKA